MMKIQALLANYLTENPYLFFKEKPLIIASPLLDLSAGHPFYLKNFSYVREFPISLEFNKKKNHIVV